MSRTKPREDGLRNPSKKFLRWDSGKQCFVYWDKDNEKSIEVSPQNIAFIVLDQLITITGFDDEKNARIWGNEVRGNKDIITMHIGKTEAGKGTHKQHRDSNKNVKFCYSVYALAKTEKGGAFELVNFQFSGASCSSWYAIVEQNGGINSIEKDDVVLGISHVENMKKGRVEYTVPIFKVLRKGISEDAAAAADAADKLLQRYLDAYLSGEIQRQKDEQSDADYDDDSFDRALEKEMPDLRGESSSQNENPFPDDDEDDVPF